MPTSRILLALAIRAPVPCVAGRRRGRAVAPAVGESPRLRGLPIRCGMSGASIATVTPLLGLCLWLLVLPLLVRANVATSLPDRAIPDARSAGRGISAVRPVAVRPAMAPASGMRDALDDPATALQRRGYDWTQGSDPAIVDRASGAVILRLAILLPTTLTAVFPRRRCDRRLWEDVR